MRGGAARRRHPGGANEDGSAVVAAVALAAVVVLLGAALALRAASDDRAAAGAVDRLQARTLAEQGIAAALEHLEHGLLAEDVRQGRAFSAVLDLDLDVLGTHVLRPGGTEVLLTAVTSDPHRGIDVKVRATVGSATHRTTMIVRPTLSSDLARFTEHSDLDPAVVGLPRDACAWSVLDARRYGGCLAAPLPPGLTEGPVHSGDHLVIGPGANLSGPVTSTRLQLVDGASWTPLVLDEALLPAPGLVPSLGHAAAQELPRDPRGPLGDALVTCRFRGPTLLRLDGTSLRVTSPRSVPRSGDPISGPEAVGCLGIDRMSLVGTVVVDLPEQVVIEVVRDSSSSCGAHPLGIPASEDLERDWPCDAGDAFVWGRYRGERTIVAEDNVQLVWDLVPGDAASMERSPDDGMAIVAGDSIVLRRTVTWPRRTRLQLGVNDVVAGPGIPPFGAYPTDSPVAVASAWEAPTIVAALAALRGSVRIQNARYGQLSAGTLTIEGSVAGRFAPAFHQDVRSPNGATIALVGYQTVLRHDGRHVTRPLPGVPRVEGGPLRILAVDLDAQPDGDPHAAAGAEG